MPFDKSIQDFTETYRNLQIIHEVMYYIAKNKNLIKIVREKKESHFLKKRFAAKVCRNLPELYRNPEMRDAETAELLRQHVLK